MTFASQSHFTITFRRLAGTRTKSFREYSEVFPALPPANSILISPFPKINLLEECKLFSSNFQSTENVFAISATPRFESPKSSFPVSCLIPLRIAFFLREPRRIIATLFLS